MTTTITVDKIESLTSQGGKQYWKLYSKEGDIYSIWLKTVAEEFAKEVGHKVNINYQQNEQGYKTIRAKPTHDSISNVITEQVMNDPVAKSTRGISQLNTLIEASKDIFICLYSAQQTMLINNDNEAGKEMVSNVVDAEHLMQLSIKLANMPKLFFEKDPIDQLAEVLGVDAK